MKKYNICVACGAGMATSKLIAEQLKTLLKDRSIDAKITVTKISDLGNAPNYDLIVTSGSLSKNLGVPVIRAMSFLTGVGIDKDFNKILEALEIEK